MHTTPWPIRILEVRAATAVRKISGALMCADQYREGCSTAQTRSKPISSAKIAWSRQSRMSCCSRCLVGLASWASKITENCTLDRAPFWFTVVLQLELLQFGSQRGRVRLPAPLPDHCQTSRTCDDA